MWRSLLRHGQRQHRQVFVACLAERYPRGVTDRDGAGARRRARRRRAVRQHLRSGWVGGLLRTFRAHALGWMVVGRGRVGEAVRRWAARPRARGHNGRAAAVEARPKLFGLISVAPVYGVVGNLSETRTLLAAVREQLEARGTLWLTLGDLNVSPAVVQRWIDEGLWPAAATAPPSGLGKSASRPQRGPRGGGVRRSTPR